MTEETHTNGVESWTQMSMIDEMVQPIHHIKAVSKTEFDMVKEFHESFGHPAPKEVTIGDEGLWNFRMMLIQEELLELTEGIKQSDIGEIADALADLVYVVLGSAVSIGLNFNDIFAEVHRSNMSKLGPDGKPIFNEHGKIIKPEGWQAPDIHKYI